MSSISVRFNSFSFLYSIFNEHKCGNLPLVGLDGFEPSTSRLSGARSNHLSYRPLFLLAFLVRPSFPLLRPFTNFAIGFCGVRSALTSPDLWVSVLPTGGDDGIRTHDPLLAGQVLSQLSYTPICSPRGHFFFKDHSDPQKLNNKSSIQAYAPTHSSFRLIWQIRENLSRSP